MPEEATLLYSAGSDGAAMLFDISKLPKTGAAIECSVEVGTFGWEGGRDVRCGPVAIRGEFHPSRYGWKLDARIEGTLGLECTRCLADFRHPLDREFQLLVVPTVTDAGDGLVFDALDEEDPQAVDLFPLEGKTLDLAEMIREQIDLDLPLKVVCQESCRGLCARCGADLNRAECRCSEQHARDHRGLEELKARLLAREKNQDPKRS